MSSGIENFYSPEAETVVIDYLKRADCRRDLNIWINTLLKINTNFGINFAVIERLCRRYGLIMHLLAIPADIELKGKPDFQIVDPNNKANLCPFVVAVYENGLDQLLDDALVRGVSYESAINLGNLSEAGVRMPKPGTLKARMMAAKWN